MGDVQKFGGFSGRDFIPVPAFRDLGELFRRLLSGGAEDDAALFRRCNAFLLTLPDGVTLLMGHEAEKLKSEVCDQSAD